MSQPVGPVAKLFAARASMAPAGSVFGPREMAALAGVNPRTAAAAAAELERAGLLERCVGGWRLLRKQPAPRVRERAALQIDLLPPEPPAGDFEGEEAEIVQVARSRGGSPENAAAGAVALAYEALLRTWRGEPRLRYLRGAVGPDKPNWRSWKGAADLAAEEAMPPADFVAAQFWWFDRAFRRPPKPYELASRQSKVPAAARAREWQQAVAAGEVDPRKPIFGGVRER